VYGWVCCLFALGLAGTLTKRCGPLALENGVPLFLLPLGEELGIFCSFDLVSVSTTALDGYVVTLALETFRSDQTLDLGGLVLGLLPPFLGWEWATDNVLPDIVLLGEVEELADLASTLGSQSPGNRLVGQAWDLTFTFLYDDQVENRQVSINNAASDRLALALSPPPWTIAGVALAEKKADTSIAQDTLLHGETLLVVSSADAHNVALPLISKRLCRHLMGHTLVIESSQLVLIINFDELLAAHSWITYIQLHPD